MMEGIYKHYDTDGTCISLHDSCADKAVLNNGILSFYLYDGFWIGSEHELSNLDYTVRTSPARVDFHLLRGIEEDIVIYYIERDIFKRDIRKTMTLSEFVKRLNRGDFEFEFLYEFKCFDSYVVDGYLRSKKRPCRRECMIRGEFSKIVYYWNELCEERRW